MSSQTDDLDITETLGVNDDGFAASCLSFRGTLTKIQPFICQGVMSIIDVSSRIKPLETGKESVD